MPALRPKLSLSLRLKIVAVSLLAFLLPPACGCYAPIPLPYEPTELPKTVTPTTFISPISPLSPLPTPTPTPEARRLLRERLLAEGRFPRAVARQLEI
ncbi:MAG: hypothetical protein KKC18_01505 [Chloroflexi bacterium]|nr:hypothetical protein [Chloroflexota bacterium]